MRATDYGIRIVLTLSAALIVSVAYAQVKPKRTNIGEPVQSTMWVGNSFFYYNNSMHGHVGLLLRASAEGQRGGRQTSATISGSGLNWHDMEAHFKPGGMGSYS